MSFWENLEKLDPVVYPLKEKELEGYEAKLLNTEPFDFLKFQKIKSVKVYQLGCFNIELKTKKDQIAFKYLPNSLAKAGYVGVNQVVHFDNSANKYSQEELDIFLEDTGKTIRVFDDYTEKDIQNVMNINMKKEYIENICHHCLGIFIK